MSLAARIRLAQQRGLSLPAARTLARLPTPRAIQDFLVDFPQNFEPEGDTARSVEQTLRHRRAHCIEGAMVARPEAGEKVGVGHGEQDSGPTGAPRDGPPAYTTTEVPRRTPPSSRAQRTFLAT